MPTGYHCVTCEADIPETLTVVGGGEHAGQQVHLLDTGPGHHELAVHTVVRGDRYRRGLTVRELLDLPEWLPPVHRHPPPRTATPVVFWTDVSEWQAAAYSAAYPHPVAAYRVSLSTTTVDRRAAANSAWCHGRVTADLLTAHTGYHVWYPGNELGQAQLFLSTVGQNIDHRFVAMIDVEQWGGAIRGDHSAEITALATILAQHLGQARVKVYGNSGDLASIYPHRPAWLGVVRASYGATAPPSPWDGWQYNDGSGRWPVPAGWPRADAPFGPTDHNAFLGTLAQFATRFGVAVAPPAPSPTIRTRGDEVILLNKATGVGVHLQPGGTAVWLHDGADAAAMHAGGVPMASVTAALFDAEVAAAGGGRGTPATADLRKHLNAEAGNQ